MDCLAKADNLSALVLERAAVTPKSISKSGLLPENPLEV